MRTDPEAGEFEFEEDDYYAVDVATSIARLFVSHPGATPQQIAGIAKALFVLGRLPSVTEGASITYGFSYRNGDDEYRETRYFDITVSDYRFEISAGGSVFEKGIGLDFFSDPDWLIEVSGFRHTELELWDLDDRVQEFLNLGAEISVEIKSDFEFEDFS